ncbi:hypothetical protein AAG570_008429 [Ranatra chinensis]|uniref:Uncharacterized protein n=1 Tax=Ranatra chinensis TaxID=642074 RepID=A0ABD0YQW1_9HEMI
MMVVLGTDQELIHPHQHKRLLLLHQVNGCRRYARHRWRHRLFKQLSMRPQTFKKCVATLLVLSLVSIFYYTHYLSSPFSSFPYLCRCLTGGDDTMCRFVAEAVECCVYGRCDDRRSKPCEDNVAEISKRTDTAFLQMNETGVS